MKRRSIKKNFPLKMFSTQYLREVSFLAAVRLIEVATVSRECLATVSGISFFRAVIKLVDAAVEPERNQKSSVLRIT